MRSKIYLKDLMALSEYVKDDTRDFTLQMQISQNGNLVVTYYDMHDKKVVIEIQDVDSPYENSITRSSTFTGKKDG